MRVCSLALMLVLGLGVGACDWSHNQSPSEVAAASWCQAMSQAEGFSDALKAQAQLGIAIADTDANRDGIHRALQAQCPGELAALQGVEPGLGQDDFNGTHKDVQRRLSQRIETMQSRQNESSYE